MEFYYYRILTMPNAEIIIPVHTTRHHMLLDCIANVRATTGREPIVWEESGNVSVARNAALAATSTEWVCFLDTDAFPQGRNWLDLMVATAETLDVAILNPREVLDFGTSTYTTYSRIVTPTRVDHPGNCSGMCLLMRRSQCLDIFDPFCGLTSGRLGPCIEDTDAARHCALRGLAAGYNPDVIVLHRDRGAADYEAWTRTDEFFAYRVMSLLLDIKWHPRNAALRPTFFQPLQSLPGRDQRRLAHGYTRADLLNCYLPILDALPAHEIGPCTNALTSLIFSTI